MSNRHNIFRALSYGKPLILRIEDDPFIPRLAKLRRFKTPNSSWISGCYGVGMSLLSNYLFENQLDNIRGPIHYVGNLNSSAGKHLECLVRRSSCFINPPIENCSIFVQDSHFDYIFQISGFEQLKSKQISFYGISDYQIFEILKPGGMLVFSSAFISACNIALLVDFLRMLHGNKYWNAKITSDAYRCFKSRVSDMQSRGEDVSGIKASYNFLKNNCINAPNDNIFASVEKAKWMHFRHFYVIGDANRSSHIVSLDEAKKVIGL